MAACSPLQSATFPHQLAAAAPAGARVDLLAAAEEASSEDDDEAEEVDNEEVAPDKAGVDGTRQPLAPIGGNWVGE